MQARPRKSGHCWDNVMGGGVIVPEKESGGPREVQVSWDIGMVVGEIAGMSGHARFIHAGGWSQT